MKFLVLSRLSTKPLYLEYVVWLTYTVCCGLVLSLDRTIFGMLLKFVDKNKCILYKKFKLLNREVGEILLATVNLSKHVMYQFQNDIQEICEPLKKSFNVTYVNYRKILSNRTRITLTTDPKWQEAYYKNKF